ncbi:unnamed protein product [Chondrus crispus]|uniref:Uncharacterized protein n=1 Tax=Chondrus crispus TaxID=2769 RepID=R7QCY7_CHOCR|nr:unnamed protein product [Chondrus crispus]CDF35633.1 unnamed protein product [Chondrus crispus]|eukprot:XP_005715452.1 unnamed protein product [Chondrus crispus]
MCMCMYELATCFRSSCALVLKSYKGIRE